MDVLSSAEFRKTYAKITKATVVTVNGHVIGTWFPGSPGDAVDFMEAVADGRIPTTPPRRHFNSRPFTPVPKRGK